MSLRQILFAALALAAPLAARAQTPDLPKKESDEQIAGRVASQPARDVGIAKIKIPPVLVAAAQAPYAPLRSCPQIAGAIRNLSATLGPDYGSGIKGRRAGVAEIGGTALVNSLIPFRGVVREVSGAAAAQRRLEAAISAGYARRGFLRGLQIARGCKR